MESAGDRRRDWLRKHFSAALGVIAFAASLLQAPWYLLGVVIAWLNFGGHDPDVSIIIFLLLPSLIGLLLGAIAMVFSRQKWGRSFGIAAWIIVATHIGLAMYVTGAEGANRLFHLFGIR